MIISDYHVHSDFSGDSQTPMEQMIERALQLGLKRLCFTDHMDYDYPEEVNISFIFDPQKYYEKFLLLKERYQKHIELLMGIELGLQPHLSDRLSKLMKQFPFDFAIGSSHVVKHMDPYYPNYWATRTKKQGIGDYFQTIIDHCKVFSDFHVYGHLDYIVRYIPAPGEERLDYSYSDYKDLLDEVLTTLISHQKGIEINTAGLKYGLGYAHPKAEVLRRYRELGGELITIGSDAHKPEHLCYDFHLIPDMLKELGFTYYANFVGGKPIYEKL